MKFVPTSLVDGQRVVAVKGVELERKIKRCENLVVGVFVGKRLAYNLVKRVTERAWKPKGSFSLTIHGEFAFIFDFNDDERSTALEHGSMYISNQLFLVQPWHPDIESEIAELKSVPIWMNFRKVPLHFWDSDGLSRIASYLGRPIMMDNQTLHCTRMSYARVCVEVDVNFDFPTTIPVVIDGTKRFLVDVEYSWKPPKCPHFHVFGHTLNGCVKDKIEKAVAAAASAEKQKTQVKEVWVVKQSKASKRNREPNDEDDVTIEDESDSTSVANISDDENLISDQNLVQCPITTNNTFTALDPGSFSRVLMDITHTSNTGSGNGTTNDSHIPTFKEDSLSSGTARAHFPGKSSSSNHSS
ncbi:uncharacterized protein LOC113340872 [Papaver somniferum]|uniref:uncharacterized protein LOC113340872 n=1 Tax=Papaver somniferum TaxID=3469 RepID=UPI000E6FC4F4|nr:uncharacterized protein LOC113340872 [Papaver somniferum]